ncbi:ferredoxin [Candidatus Bipolaricaulota bacterium]|nr:ferredoxin [Candidatus Bipolaricaulota bacterium]
MAKYKLKYDKDACQSNFVCTAVDPEHFKEGEDGKAELIGGSNEDGNFVLEVEETDRQAAEQAANGCPMMAIELVDSEAGETIAP